MGRRTVPNISMATANSRAPAPNAVGCGGGVRFWWWGPERYEWCVERGYGCGVAVLLVAQLTHEQPVHRVADRAVDADDAAHDQAGGREVSKADVTDVWRPQGCPEQAPCGGPDGGWHRTLGRRSNPRSRPRGQCPWTPSREGVRRPAATQRERCAVNIDGQIGGAGLAIVVELVLLYSRRRSCGGSEQKETRGLPREPWRPWIGPRVAPTTTAPSTRP